jgi:hypothetical protein
MFDSATLTSAYLLSVLAGMQSTLASENLRGVLCEISGTESEVEKLLRVFETNGFAIVRRPPSSSGSYIFDRS